MNPRKIGVQLLSVACACLLAGCYAIGVYPKNTAKSVADILETIPIGTSLEQMAKDPRLNKLNFQKPLQAGYTPIVDLTTNPLGKGQKGLCLYRQFPRGILLNITEDDLHGQIAVSEMISQDGRVDVFYDKNYHFKGYFAYSYVKYSDDGERLRMEKESFRELGMEDLSRRCRQWGKLIGAGAEKEKSIPHLPLSQYIRTDGKQ